MKMYQIETPDGRIIPIEADENASDEELISLAQQKSPGYETKVDRRAQLGLAPLPEMTLGDNMARTATFGATDVAGGITAAVINAIKAPLSDEVDFDPGAAYSQQFSDGRAAHEKYRDENWWTALGGDLLGGAAGLRGELPQIYKAAEGATLPFLQRAANSSALGAGFGGLTGFGNGEGFERISEGLLSALAGGTIGGAMTGVGQMFSPVIGGIKQLLGGGDGLAVKRLAETMKSSGIEPADLGARMDSDHALGVPMMMADYSENLQRLLGAVGRQPGAGREIARTALRDRQMGSYDRVLGAVNRDLGPTTNINEQSQALIERARRNAGPLYDEAYAAPPVASPELEEVLATPAARSAVGRARTIAANERRDPEALGFAIDAEGNVVLNPTMQAGEDEAGDLILSQLPDRVRSYSPQTLDYVKRGVDDQLEPYRNEFTGRLDLDEMGGSIDQVRRDLLSELDRLNPAYGQARAAYAGPASEREALLRGKSALTKSGADIDIMTGNLTPTQREQFALGMRAELADKLGKRVDGANLVGGILGTPQRRAAIQRAGGEGANLDQFGRTMDAERMAGDTFRIATGGSPTAVNMADDQIVGDAGVISDAVGRTFRGYRGGGVIGGIANLLAPLADTARFGAGNTGERVRQSLASLLTETDPAALIDVMSSLENLGRQTALRGQNIHRVGNNASARLGGTIGGFVSAPTYQGQ